MTRNIYCSAVSLCFFLPASRWHSPANEFVQECMVLFFLARDMVHFLTSLCFSVGTQYCGTSQFDCNLCVDITHVRIRARLCYAAKSGCEHVCSRSFCSVRLIQILGATAFCG